MRILKNILLTPILLLHELSHVIVTYILGGKLESVDVYRHEKGHPVVKLDINGLDKGWKLKVVAMAPLLIPVTLLFLTMINVNFVYVLVYLTLFYKTALPSPTDFKVAGWVVPKFLEV